MISRKNKKMTIMLCFIMGIALLCSLLALGPDMNAQAAGRSEEPPEIFDIFIPVIANEYPPTCEQGIANGGFEEDSDWVLPVTAYSAVYSTANPLSGDRSLHAGISDSVDNIFSYSSARQEVTIPEGIPEAVLSFWLYPISSETGTLRLADNLLNIEEKDAEESSDAQLVIILDSSGEELERLLTIRENDQVWKPYSFDLAHYAGETIQIYFGVYNNGLGGVTSMFVDDVSLDYCETVPPPPIPYAGRALPTRVLSWMKIGWFQRLSIRRRTAWTRRRAGSNRCDRESSRRVRIDTATLLSIKLLQFQREPRMQHWISGCFH